MARAHCREVLVAARTIDGIEANVILNSATVNVYETGTTTPIAVTMYDAASGGSTIANPLSSSSTTGEIEFWLDEPRTVDLLIAKSGYTSRTVTVDVFPPGEKYNQRSTGSNAQALTVSGENAGGAIINFKPAHEDGYCQLFFHPEGDASNPDVIITAHKELSGTETIHRHLTLYTSPSIGAAPSGRFDLWYGQDPTVGMWSGTLMQFNTDSYWNLDPAAWWTSGSFNPDFEVRGDATGNNRGIKLVNTAASGHSWRLAESSAVGRLSFQDLTASGTPRVLTLDGTNQRIGIGSNKTAPSQALDIDQPTVVLTGAISNGTSAGIQAQPRYDQTFGVTFHNYLTLNTPTLTNGATVTHAALANFPSAAGTHKAVDAGTTKTTPGTVDAWVKVLVNGTIHYLPAYTSKTT